MTRIPKGSVAVLLGIAFACGGCMAQVKSAQGDTRQDAQNRMALAKEVMDQWSSLPALTARRFIEEYGVPDEVRHDRIVWNWKGPWERTVVQDQLPPLVDTGQELGIVAQTIRYPLTPDQAADVSAFDPKVSFNAKTNELTSLSDREENNFLRLNLAGDVASGRLTPGGAKDNFQKILQFEAAGKTSPYLEGLYLNR